MVCAPTTTSPTSPPTIHKFDLSKRKVDKFMDDVNDFAVSADGEKMLYRKGEQFIAAGDRRSAGRRIRSPATVR